MPKESIAAPEIVDLEDLGLCERQDRNPDKFCERDASDHRRPCLV